jgi:hypothetical protein
MTQKSTAQWQCQMQQRSGRIPSEHHFTPLYKPRTTTRTVATIFFECSAFQFWFYPTIGFHNTRKMVYAQSHNGLATKWRLMRFMYRDMVAKIGQYTDNGCISIANGRGEHGVLSV